MHEGIDSLILSGKASAQWYQSVANSISMIYIITGKIEFESPT